MLVPLTKGQVALIDTADAELIGRHRWIALEVPPLWYAITFVPAPDGRQRGILMHRLLMGDPPVEVDHVNGDGLRNVRSNLRLATDTEQTRNRSGNWNNESGYKGVRRANQREGWTAFIMLDGRYVHLGTFTTREEAAHARDAAERAHYGEFARLNFPADHDD